MSPHSPLLIRDVELDDGWPADVLLRDGIVADAEALWERITIAIPTVNPASNPTFINPVAKP